MFRMIQNACRSKQTVDQIASTFLGKFSRNTKCVIRWKNTEAVRPYRAAILEDFNTDLVIEKIKNRTILGDGMVSLKYKINSFETCNFLFPF